ncbi:MAG: helix-turn-helix transcriptional regulator [Rhodocyclaceae bacterium]|nr:helix-turn-helix transcriptional regulator [Rhodocyclaceae bacterium]
MNDVQVIEQNGKPAFYVVPAAIWESVRDAIEDAEDAMAASQALANDDGIRFPNEVMKDIISGASRLRAWRNYRGMTVQALAEAAGLSKAFVSQIESGKRTGTTDSLSKLARALGAPIGAIIATTD